jgi:hypothetical protein
MTPENIIGVLSLVNGLLVLLLVVWVLLAVAVPTTPPTA